MKREEALKVAKPILFNTEMVRAIQDGTKTVTRRVAFPNKDLHEFISSQRPNGWWFRGRVAKSWDNILGCINRENPCKHRIGDILYVRETWCDPSKTGYPILYKADMPVHWDKENTDIGEPVDLKAEDYKWKPSIHMPKEAARIFLRVTGIRVERLQDITDKQIVAEGCNIPITASDEERCLLAFVRFPKQWNSTVKKTDLDKYGWIANPWVWVIEFEKVEVTE